MCSREVSASPGPPLVGGGPSERKNFGSLTGDRYRPGCRESAACSAVVPALGTPATRKSGSAIVPLLRRECAAFTTFLVILISIVSQGQLDPLRYPSPAEETTSPLATHHRLRASRPARRAG